MNTTLRLNNPSHPAWDGATYDVADGCCRILINSANTVLLHWQDEDPENNVVLLPAVVEKIVSMLATREAGNTSKLSDRIRPNSEAAPWVVEAVKKLEAELAIARLFHRVAVEERDDALTYLRIERTGWIGETAK